MEHAANVVKWKADQQRRILAKQGEIRDVESKIRDLKSSLAEAVLELHEAGKLKQDALVDICGQIDEYKSSITTKEDELESMRDEEAPEEPEGQAIPAGTETSGLVCPECGRALVGKFCPEHGAEGVEPEPPAAADEAAEESAE
jgi:DNA repair exonuclease SbcCD ATPase subunit